MVNLIRGLSKQNVKFPSHFIVISTIMFYTFAAFTILFNQIVNDAMYQKFIASVGQNVIETFDPQGTMTLDALDQAVLMKILPRIAGERDYIEKVYGDKETVGLRSALVGKTVSLDKINEILERAKNTNANYITFWP